MKHNLDYYLLVNKVTLMGSFHPLVDKVAYQTDDLIE